MAMRQQMYETADWVAGALGVAREPLSAPELVHAAERRTGLADFGDVAFAEPLDVLLRAYNVQAALSAFGRIAARWDTVRFLSNLLRLRDAEKTCPAILDQAIDGPIFIMGMPRSGSSFLHQLLAQDENNRVVCTWHAIDPSPAGADWHAHSRAAARKVEGQIRAFVRLAPELPGLHPIGAHSPQECAEITGHVFRSLRFDTTHHVPDYRDWLDTAGHLDAYRFHQRFLKHLQHHLGPGRWILKCPDHVFALDALLAVYPGARFVFTHRDPLEVLPSVARLTEVLRRPFTRSIDRAKIGRQVSERWAAGAARLIEAAETPALAERAFHIRFASFVQDPARWIAALYERFGLAMGAEFMQRVRDYVAARPAGGYAGQKSDLASFGLLAPVERRRFDAYTSYFGV